MTNPSSQVESLRGASGADSVESVWPLVPFEKLILKNDSPHAPMVFRVAMRFEGPVRADLLAEAFRIAVNRQPLLKSQVVTINGVRSWQSCSAAPELSWQSSDLTQTEIEKLPIEWVDLRENPGLSVRLWQVDDGLSVLLDVHHACADGQGARQLISEWWGLYSQLLDGSELKLASMEVSKLGGRGVYRHPDPPVSLREGLRNLFVTIRGKTVRLPRRADAGSIDCKSDFLGEVTLSPEITGSLRKRFREQGFTINDIAVSASFMAFVKYFPQVLKPNHFITLLHPVDLRWPSDLRMPACNRVGVCFLRRRVRDLTDMTSTLNWVRGEMLYVKQRYIGAEFLRGLAMTDKQSGATDLLTRWGYFVPTLQFTCLGDTTRTLHYRFPQKEGVIDFHGLKLTKISGIMQMGPLIPLSLAACESNQRLSLTLRGSTQFVTPTQAEEFLNVFVDQIVTSLPESGPSSSGKS